MLQQATEIDPASASSGPRTRNPAIARSSYRSKYTPGRLQMLCRVASRSAALHAGGSSAGPHRAAGGPSRGLPQGAVVLTPAAPAG